ncbi:hypothetical protein HRI96_05265 [Treponema parvum]|uniref:Cobalt transport protein n=1 Tax=Treponema parvum TaxID=138851 RepID=A0A975EZJ3_9SPIR|nr:energy-coupling factor transporter transmembrane component T [Treponema parvum]QTQ11663.1 hypothetical protein HRI96_05265 [Treponema parvum]
MEIKRQRATTDFILYGYRIGNSFLHKIPAGIKLLAILVWSVCILYAPAAACAAFFLILILFALKAEIPFSLLTADLTPIFYYGILLYVTSALSKKNFMPSLSDVIFCFRLLTMLMMSSILFRTTTPLELKSALEEIEIFVRKKLRLKPKAEISVMFSYFLLFLPRIFTIWNDISRAYKARGGKNDIKKIFVLFPILISLSIHKAWNTALAAEARSR